MPLFLVMCRLQSEGSKEVFESFVETCNLCVDLQKNGVVKVFGAFSDLSGGAIIVEANSEEEVLEMANKLPAKPFVHTEVKRLLSPDELKSIKL